MTRYNNLYRSWLKNPTQCFVGVCFAVGCISHTARRVNRRALGKFQLVLVYYTQTNLRCDMNSYWITLIFSKIVNVLTHYHDTEFKSLIIALLSF